MGVGHNEDLQLVLLVHELCFVQSDRPSLLPDSAVRIVEGNRVVNVGHPDVTLRRRTPGKTVVILKIVLLIKLLLSLIAGFKVGVKFEGLVTLQKRMSCVFGSVNWMVSQY